MPDFIDRLMATLRAGVSLEDGQTIAEYGLVTVLVALAVVIDAQLLGTNLFTVFNTAVNGL
jgi:Flp pilus assembly pilin Flp